MSTATAFIEPQESFDAYQVRFTRDYKMFRFNPVNRGVKDPTVKKLVQAITETNFIAPIFVTPDHIVVDGQHRLVAAQVLNKPVPYMYVPGATLRTIMLLNSVANQWKIRNFFEAYAKHGLEDYQAAVEFAKVHRLPVASIPKMVNPQQSPDACRTGQFVFTPEEQQRLERLMETVDHVARWHKHTRKAAFLTAMSRLSQQPQYDEVSFIRSFEALCPVPSPSAHTDQYKVLVDIMNYRRPAKNHIKV